jgi:ABC-type phosphate transport system auxiliary subunit
MTPAQIIGSLNALHRREIDVIRSTLSEARMACLELRQETLAEQLDEADQALRRADLRTYRKRVETVIAKLGHLK